MIAGDLFHVRGSIKPSVFNKVVDFFNKNPEINYVILAGNHDLETKDATKETSALTPLGELVNVSVVNEPTNLGISFLPWIESIQIDDIKNAFDFSQTYASRKDLILHAPISGVFDHIPDGLSPDELAKLPFRRVFSGHFHSYKQLNEKVYSIGSIAQFTFGDKDNKTGFLVVYPEKVFRFESNQPKFKEMNLTSLKGFDYTKIDNTYLKVNLDAHLPQDKLETLRSALIKKGAKGVIFQTVRQNQQRSEEDSVKAGASLEVSVSQYIDTLKDVPQGLTKNCLRILAELE